MLTNLKKLFVGATLLAASASSFANLPFTFDSTSVGGAEFDATVMSGFYNEAIRITDLGTGAFSATVLLDFNAFKDQFDNGLRGTGLGNDYGLYSIINITGFLTEGAPNFKTGFWSGDLELFIDPDFNTNSNMSTALTDVGVTALTGNGEDLSLFSGAIAGGQSNGTVDSASFSLVSTDIALDATNGSTFFTAPDPFYNILLSFGQLEEFFADVVFTTTDLQRFAGEANVRFVPEPSAIAFLGLGLFALAFRSRSK